jgi:DNA-directed RNA polymerase II subunit RPB1
MNIFLPQSLQTQIELEEIAGVEKQIISPTNSKTIVGIVQDGLLGSYNLTAPTMRIDWRNAMNLMSYTTLENFSSLKKNKDYTGSELYSLIIPPNISLDRPNLKVNKGSLVSGQLTNEFLGSKKTNTIIQLIWDAYGVLDTKNFIDNTQRLINNFNLYNGFSVGFKDSIVSDDIIKQINTVYNNKELETEKLITDMENNPSIMPLDIFELKLFSEYSTVRDKVIKIVMNSLNPKNGFYIMIKSGSKGKDENMGQMSGGLGMQAFEGKLIPKKYNKRTLSYFAKNDDRGASRGLNRNPFISGMAFPEYVFHLLCARLGLIEQSIKTADTGYAQRKLVKSMEDIMIKNDGTVRTANDLLLQVVYGTSGVDTTKQYEYILKMINMNNAEMENVFKFTDNELKEYNFSKDENNIFFKNLLNIRDITRKNVQRAKLNYIVIIERFMLPVNLRRIIDNAIATKTDNKNSDKLEPSYIIGKINDILSNQNTQLMCMSVQDRNNVASFKNKDELVHKLTFKNCIFDSLSPKRVLIEYGLNKLQFDNVVKQIIDSYNKNIIEPGEMAGVIAAQSMGEPLTQMTLNSFHHAGISSMGATIQGVPRIKELMSVSKNPKTPEMIVYLTDDYKNNKEMSYKIASHIKYTTFGNIRDRINVYYDSFPKEKGSIMDQDEVSHVFYNANNKTGFNGDISDLPWLLRIEINKSKMFEKEITLLEIKSKFCSWWEKRFTDSKTIKKEEKKVINKISNLAVLSNSDNSINPTVHIRFNVKDDEKDPFNLETINNFIDHIIDKFKLKGITSVNEISAIPEERNITFNKITGDVEKGTHYVIKTGGINMIDIRYLIGIDLLKTISNDVVEMYKNFGIEVARTVLLKEIMSAYEKAGSEVNYQHITLIADLMTSSGFISSIDRHGMSKSDTDPLSRASFEKSVEQLITASVFGEIDHMKGMSSRIMAGAVIKGGTGYCDVVLNTDMIENSESSNYNDYQEDFNEITTSTIASDIINQKNSTGFFIPK